MQFRNTAMRLSTMPRVSGTALALAFALSVGSVWGFPNQFSALRIRASPTRLYNDKGSNGEDNQLFEDYMKDENRSKNQETVAQPTTISAQFGDSVPLMNPTAASFGESVPLKRPSSSVTDSSFCNEESSSASSLFSTESQEVEQPEELKAMKQRNIIVAIASVVLAVSSYVWQFTHPITPVQLLATMQSNSAPLTTIGTNGKPTVVDFWAPWCENCKMAAPTLSKLEEEYNGKVNFVMVNGDRPEAWPLIERFGVDAIPHIALISDEGDVETALIGPIPKRVLAADLDVLLDNAKNKNDESKTDLPYKMLDVFANAPEYRRIKFQIEE